MPIYFNAKTNKYPTRILQESALYTFKIKYMQRSTTIRITPKFNLGLRPRILTPVISSTTPPFFCPRAEMMIDTESNTSSISIQDGKDFLQTSEIGDISRSTHRASSYSFFNATCITPSIYLGSYSDALCAEILLEHGITHVLNISEECPISESLLAHHDTIEIMQVPIKDHSDEPIHEHFKDCIEFIHGAVSRGEKILIHCRMGVSRSATIVLAYLMRYGISGSLAESPICYDAAFSFLKTKRPIICPNLGFTMALYDWDIVGDPADIFKCE
jgi:predicted protein tyrosine phosphatase